MGLPGTPLRTRNGVPGPTRERIVAVRYAGGTPTFTMKRKEFRTVQDMLEQELRAVAKKTNRENPHQRENIIRAFHSVRQVIRDDMLHAYKGLLCHSTGEMISIDEAIKLMRDKIKNFAAYVGIVALNRRAMAQFDCPEALIN